VEELILQILGAGGDEHLLPAQQRRHQVGEGLAGAGAGLGDEQAIIVQRRRHRLGHFLLLAARSETGDMRGQRAIGAESERGAGFEWVRQ